MSATVPARPHATTCRRLTLVFACSSVGTINLDGDPASSQSADELKERDPHDLGNDDGEKRCATPGGARAEQNAPEPLPRRERAAGERDTTALSPERRMLSYDLADGNPERRRHYVCPEITHVSSPRSLAAPSRAGRPVTTNLPRGLPVYGRPDKL